MSTLARQDITGQPGFLESEFPPAEAGRARFHVLPVPYERSVSYGTGTATAPEAILRASQQLEALIGTACPGEHGIFTQRVPALSDDVEDALQQIHDVTAESVRLGAIPILLGGEHTITVPALRAVRERWPGIGVVQFDAHADLRHTYQGTPWSHACVMRRIHEMGVPFCQIGVRSLSPEENDFRQEQQIPSLHPRHPPADTGTLHRLLAHMPSTLYVTVDVDCLDPGVMPATGTPEPGGLDWWTFVSILEYIGRNRTIVAADVVELAPIPVLHHCDYTAAKIAYLLMAVAHPTS